MLVASFDNTYPFHDDIKKYGAQNFKVEILESVTDGIELMAREKHYISLHNTRAPRGYNLINGGSGRRTKASLLRGLQLAQEKFVVAQRREPRYVRPRNKNCEVDMDFEAAWAFVRSTRMEDHSSNCSYRLFNGEFLCDCRVLDAEMKKRFEEGWQKELRDACGE